MFHSLRWQIIIAFGLVILLAVLLSASAAFWITQREFNVLVLEEGEALAFDLALYVESQYNLVGGWQALPVPLLAPEFKEGVVLEGVLVDETEMWPEIEWGRLIARELGLSWGAYEHLREEETVEELAIKQGVDPNALVGAIVRSEVRAFENEPLDDAVFAAGESLFWARVYVYESLPTEAYEEEWFEITAESPFAAVFFDGSRTFVTDAEGMVIFDSENSEVGEPLSNDLLARAAAVYEWETGEVVGYVAVPSGEGYYDEEEDAFLQQVTQSLAMGGLLATGMALVIGSLLAQRITAPVTALTQAATHLAESGNTEPLPVYSANELGQMSHAFNQMTEALDTQRMLRQRLIADISHELGTPLSVIRLETRALEDGMQSVEEGAAQIQREVALLQNLVQDLTLIAETDRGKLTLLSESVVLERLLEQIVARWEARAERAGVQLELTPLPSLPNLTLDRLRFRQILGNLIKNAIRHTPNGGMITLSVEHTTPEHLTGSNWIVIAVRDTGEGIPPQDLPLIFERFYRVDQARERRQGGRGLGLSIVKQLVELHGGNVWAESVVGEGSTFYVALRL